MTLAAELFAVAVALIAGFFSLSRLYQGLRFFSVDLTKFSNAVRKQSPAFSAEGFASLCTATLPASSREAAIAHASSMPAELEIELMELHHENESHVRSASNLARLSSSSGVFAAIVALRSELSSGSALSLDVSSGPLAASLLCVASGIAGATTAIAVQRALLHVVRSNRRGLVEWVDLLESRSGSAV